MRTESAAGKVTWHDCTPGLVWTEPDCGTGELFFPLLRELLVTAVEACSDVHFVGGVARVASNQLDFST